MSVTSEPERHAQFLRLLESGKWYCVSDYEGCEVLEPGTPVRGKMFLKLVDDGLVEATPVFDGFTMLKYRITPAGAEWLASQ